MEVEPFNHCLLRRFVNLGTPPVLLYVLTSKSINFAADTNDREQNFVRQVTSHLTIMGFRVSASVRSHSRPGRCL
jgi:hypothetical protein